MGLFASSTLVVIFFLLSMLHIYWVLGGKWGLSGAIPDVMKSSSLANPSGLGFRIATILVAFGLMVMSYVFLVRTSFISSSHPLIYFRYATYAIIAIFSIRAIGDFKYFGLFKKIKEGEFASKDSKYYSPLCLTIALLAIFTLV